MRDYNGALTFEPRLPKEWGDLEYILHWQGTRLTVLLERERMTVRAGEGAPVPFDVRGQSYLVEPGGQVVVELDGQGPDIPGRPTLRELIGERREDGTLLSASVPTTVTTTIPVITAPVPTLDVVPGRGLGE